MSVPGALRMAGRLENLGLPGVSAVLRRIYPLAPSAPRFWSGVVTRADGLRMHVDTRRHIERVYLVNGQYEPHLTALMRELVRPGDRVLDIGANIGGHTLTLAQAAGPTGEITAYEPNPQALSDLRRNIALNDLRNVTVRATAVGDAPGMVQLRVPLEQSAEGANAGLASIDALDTPHSTVDVPVVAIDSEIPPSANRPIRLVKIDIQGYEPRAFMGMAGLLRADRPFIIFEYEPWAIRRSGFDAGWLWDFFVGLGYRLVGTQGHDRRDLTKAELSSADSAEILAVPNDLPRGP